MRRFFKYMSYLVRHKWFVTVECFKVGLYWRGLKHDWTKFMPSAEFIPYMNFFYAPDGSKKQRRDKTGYYKPDDTGDAAFDAAWLHHQKWNDHHWQWHMWVDPSICGCYAAANGGSSWVSVVRNLFKRSSASHAGSSGRGKTSSTAESSGTSAATTTENGITRTTSTTSRSEELGTGNATPTTERLIASECENSRSDTGPGFLNTIAVASRSAPAAGSEGSSSSRSTTRGEAAPSSVGTTRPTATEGLPPTDGASRTTSRRSSGSSATTATAHTASTALVPIRKTSLLALDDGGMRCMACGKRWAKLPKDDGTLKVFEMSPEARLEMVCDWKGAGRAQGVLSETGEPEVLGWYRKNKDKMTLGPLTRVWVETEIGFSP